MKLYPVILAGGSGTRLWPLSRELYPKEFLALSGQNTMLQDTLCRLDGLSELADTTIACNETYRFMVAEQVRQLGKTTRQIILEPEERDTAPALTLAALDLQRSAGGEAADPVMLVMPADHLIKNVPAFLAAVQQGRPLAEQGWLVTFGVNPTSPKTCYGYIKCGEELAPVNGTARTACRVAQFLEKPDSETARIYLESGRYLWNSGIFMMRASVWLELLRQHRPEIAQACQTAYAQGSRDGDFYRPDAARFADCPGESIDYAVIEPAALITGCKGHNGSAALSYRGCVTAPMDAGWSDVNSWSTLWENDTPNDQGNVIKGDVKTRRVQNSLLVSEHRLVAAAGVENVVVIETPDAVLVAGKDKAQEVQELVAQLKAERRTEQENQRKVYRPWGSYEVIDRGERFQVKRLTVNPGGSLSLQMHHHRAEHWVVVKGTAQVTRGDEKFLLTENQSTYIPVGMAHRLENPGTLLLEIIEVQSGSYLGEDDIVRLEDRYNRAGPPALARV